MRIPSGTTDQYIYIIAVSTTDYVTRVTDLTSFIAYASRNGSTGTLLSTAAITVVNSTQMPGVYKVLLNDSTVMDIAAGNDSEEVAIHITSSMAPVTRTFELYRRTVTTGATLAVDSSGAGNANLVEVAGTATNTTLAQLGVNLVSINGSTIATGTAQIGTNVVSMAANTVTASALATDAVDEIFNEPVEGAYTFREVLRGWTAALLGKASGLGTATAIYRNTDDDVNVITATVDADGNRTAITLDLDDTA
jgi:hypothetical protein